MPNTFHALVTGMLNGGFDAIDRVLAKGSAFCAETGLAEDELLQARLHETMYPAVRQIMICTDNAKGAMCRLTGTEPPRWEDTEKTYAEIRARIAKARGLIASKSEADFAGAETRRFDARFGQETINFSGEDYVRKFLIPNFNFHVATLYGIFRSKGVPLVKKDLLGW